MGEISKKMQDKRRTISIGKRVMVMAVPGKRRNGRPKRRWLDNTKNNTYVTMVPEFSPLVCGILTSSCDIEGCRAVPKLSHMD